MYYTLIKSLGQKTDSFSQLIKRLTGNKSLPIDSDPRGVGLFPQFGVSKSQATA